MSTNPEEMAQSSARREEIEEIGAEIEALDHHRQEVIDRLHAQQEHLINIQKHLLQNSEQLQHHSDELHQAHEQSQEPTPPAPTAADF
jgi:hypothetical protein